MPGAPDPIPLLARALRVVERRGRIGEEELLAYLFGAVPPEGVRRALLAPLLETRRLVRHADGTWQLAHPLGPGAGEGQTAREEFCALACGTTGARPDQGRLAGVAALLVDADGSETRLSTTLQLDVPIPSYTRRRLGVPWETLDRSPAFGDIGQALLEVLRRAPVVVQEAECAASFLRRECDLVGWPPPSLQLIDAGALAAAVLQGLKKPTLVDIAAACGLAATGRETLEGEARLLARVAPVLLRQARAAGMLRIADLPGYVTTSHPVTPRALRNPSTSRALPDAPGVYVMYDGDERPLYVGKATRLSERVAAYTGRPLGVSRRLQGLAEAASRIGTDVCPSDLEAFVMEQRRIASLGPRFNVQHAVRPVRLWIHLLDPRPTKRGKVAPPRLRLAAERPSGDPCVGPFLNEAAARAARNVARTVFDLDAARSRESLEGYVARVGRAWAFLQGNTEEGAACARAALAAAIAVRNQDGVRRWRSILDQARGYDLGTALLPDDPRSGSLAVIRPGGKGLEGFRLDAGLLTAHARAGLQEPHHLVEVLAEGGEPRTRPDDVELVLRWLGAQRRSARVISLAGGEPVVEARIYAAFDAVASAQAHRRTIADPVARVVE